MLAQLQSLLKGRDIQLNWVDIDDDDALEDQYGTMIPVLLGDDGEMLCFYHLNVSKLEKWIAGRQA
ncbi:glutaredoxin family protein [Burkholderiaceae bacterium DAT-1]|nr:glutaredoxin family protein [Burkholderiaceae bacterium DAT-1]